MKSAGLFFAQLLALALLVFAQPCLAAELKTQSAAQKVGVGQNFELQVTVTSEDEEGAVRAPQLPLTGAASVHGPKQSTQHRVMMHNFSIRTEKSTVFSWTIRPQAVGKIIVGPASVQVGGKTLRGQPITVEVVEEPQQPPRRSRSPWGPDPFDDDFFGKDPFGKDPFDIFGRASGAQQLPEAPPELRLSHAKNDTAFLVTKLEKSEVVLGEPVGVTITAYGARGDFYEQSPQSPSLASFISYPVIENSRAEPAYQTTIDGKTFVVRKLRQFVLVPLKTGTLKVGKMTAVLQNNRRAYPARGSARGTSVESQEAKLRVVPAPLKNQPAGYFPGDVGRYRLKAELSPSQVKQGEYVELLVTISGRGNLPSAVLLPEGNAVSFGAAKISGAPEVKNGTLQGTRTLRYTAQVHEPGKLNLEPVRLVHFDERAKRYRIAKAALATIDVAPESSHSANAADDSAPPDAVASPPAPQSKDAPLLPRKQLLPLAQGSASPPPILWWLVAGIPLVAFLLLLLVRWGQKLKQGLGQRPRDGAKQLLHEAAHLSSSDRARALLLTERALFSAIETHAGIKARGVLRSELAEVLKNAGLAADLSSKIGTLLQTLEEERFGTAKSSVTRHIDEAKALVAALGKRKKPSDEKQPGVSTATLTLLVVLSPFFPQPAEAQPLPTSNLQSALQESAKKLDAGALGEVIAQLEQLADRGIAHPDLSFNRGLSYLRRAESRSSHVGDFGQAAAGFLEAVQMRPGDALASRGLELAQHAVARRQANTESSTSIDPLGLAERALLFLSPWWLWLAAALASAACTCGLVLAQVGRGSSQVGGRIAGTVGALMLVPLLGLSVFRAELASEMRVGVVITSQALLLDETGVRQAGKEPLAEGTVVHIKPAENGLALLVSLTQRSFLRSNQLRYAAQRGSSK